MTLEEQHELLEVLSELLKEYRRVRLAYLTGVQNDVKPPSWETEKSVLLFFGQGSEEQIELQKNKF